MKRVTSFVFLAIAFILFTASVASADLTLSSSAKGLLSDVQVTIIMRNDGTIADIEVNADGETYAISYPCTQPEFLNQFIDRTGPFSDIDTVAGATFTSNAIIKAVNNIYAEFDFSDAVTSDLNGDYAKNLNEQRYQKALSNLNAGEYYLAQRAFAQLGDYKDSKEQAKTAQSWIDYSEAETLIGKGKYQQAYTTFKNLGDFNDSAEKAYVVRLAALAETTDSLNDCIRYRLQGVWGLIDFANNTITKPEWDSITRGHDDLFIIEKSDRFGLMFKDGQVKIYPEYERLSRTLDGYFIATEYSGKQPSMYLINSYGNVLTPDGCLTISNIHVTDDLTSTRLAIFPFDDPVPTQTMDHKWGFISPDGLWTIKPKYDDALFFTEGLAAVKTGDYWQYINAQNKVVIAGKYTQATSFSNGLAQVYLKDHGWQIIDSTGTAIYFGK